MDLDLNPADLQFCDGFALNFMNYAYLVSSEIPDLQNV